MMVAERKYALTRLSAGDYLLPSNDGQTLWRIYSYEEDGSAAWQDADGKWHSIHGTRWATAKYRHPLTPDTVIDGEAMYDEDWHHWSMGCRTRKEAIEDALGASE